MVSLVSTLLLLAPLVVRVVCYKVVRDYSGDNFFSGWDFYGNFDDQTFGDVWWVNKSDALSQGLAYVSNGRAILKVDNTSNVALGEKRKSVRITSTDAYGLGSLWIIDLVHLPWGCSVWPIFWTNGRGAWPEGGEIDIIEATNLQVNNQMAVHTLPGCTHTGGGGELGVSRETNCSKRSGCTVDEAKPGSLQGQFAAAGGGVWATQFDVSGIIIWFWRRPDIPQSIRNSTAQSSIDISDWGSPSAIYSNTTCDINGLFSVQNLILEITLCGEWAGLPVVYQSQCNASGPTGRCYEDNVVGAGSPRFDEAFFEISYVRAYTTDGIVPKVWSSSAVALSLGRRLSLWQPCLIGVFVILSL